MRHLEALDQRLNITSQALERMQHSPPEEDDRTRWIPWLCGRAHCTQQERGQATLQGRLRWPTGSSRLTQVWSATGLRAARVFRAVVVWDAHAAVFSEALAAAVDLAGAKISSGRTAARQDWSDVMVCDALFSPSQILLSTW
jgi:hypothetical protein